MIDTGGAGGAETVFSTLAGYGQRDAINAAVAVPYDGWLAARLRSQGINPIILPSKNVNAAMLAYCLWRLAKRSGANLIHAHLLGASVYASLVGTIRDIPVVAVFHGETDLKGIGSFRFAKGWLLNRPHVVPVAVSDAVQEAMDAWGIRRDAIRLIRNGVDTVEFDPHTAGSLHAEFGLTGREPIVGAVGNIRPAKSYDVLIEAAQLVTQRRPDAHFVIAGGGNEHDTSQLQSLIERHGLVGRFHLLGFRQSSAGLYRSFTVLASSAHTEGLPLSFLEAMACEIPIAATANEGAARLIRETKAGLLSPVGQPAALADSIITLLGEHDKASVLARNGRTAAVKSFSIERTLSEYRRLYDNLLRRAG